MSGEPEAQTRRKRLPQLAPYVALLVILMLSRCSATLPERSPERTAPSASEDETCASGRPAPDVYRARVATSKGPFVIEVHRDWAPASADHFYDLICANFYTQARFYRVVKGFVVQFGMNADPSVHQVWQQKKLEDEPVRTSNKRGTVAFTGSATPNSRTTHVFVNLADNAFLDQSSPPFGFVSSGIEVVDSLYNGYGEHAPMGTGPEQNKLWVEDNRYLQESFPKLDYIIDITIEQ